MKIAILGNCQAAPVADAFKASTSGVTIEQFNMDSRLFRREGPSNWAQRIAECDLLLTQPLKSAAVGALRSDLLARTVPNILYWPRIFFTGFQPDIVVLSSLNRADAWPPGGVFHSAIILGCFLSGIPEHRVRPLFNAYVYAKLGFFPDWKKTKAEFIESVLPPTPESAAEGERWFNSGCFMYTNNHPNRLITYSVARHLAKSNSLKWTDVPVETLPDPLEVGVIWPIYPEIAERIGLRGGTTIRLAKTQTEPDRWVQMEEFIAMAYKFYAGTPKSALEVHPQAVAARDAIAALGVR